MRMSVAERVQKHREALRASGLRPVQIWVADTRQKGFAEECRRQSLSIQGAALEKEVAGWLDVFGDQEGWH
jgi:hypothetical protein